MNTKQAKRQKKLNERQLRHESMQQRSVAKSTDDLLKELRTGRFASMRIATLATEELSPQGKKVYQELKQRIMNGIPIRTTQVCGSYRQRQRQEHQPGRTRPDADLGTASSSRPRKKHATAWRPMGSHDHGFRPGGGLTALLHRPTATRTGHCRSAGCRSCGRCCMTRATLPGPGITTLEGDPGLDVANGLAGLAGPPLPDRHRAWRRPSVPMAAARGFCAATRLARSAS